LKIPFINIHKHGVARSPDELAVSNIFPGDLDKCIRNADMFFSVGIHPWYIRRERLAMEFALMEEALGQKNIVAVGETGLDRKVDIPFDLQKEVFIRQLHLAARFEKPVVIHCVKAFPDIISIVKKERFKGKVIFHGFNANRQIMESLLKNDFFLSFGHALLNEKTNAAKLFAGIPDDRFFLETDESEVGIKMIYQRAADLKGTTVENIRSMVSDNFSQCFNNRINYGSMDKPD